MESPFKINSIKVIGNWTYNLTKNTDCTICRCNLNSDSIYAQENDNHSVISIGMCGHCFHTECIGPWEKKNGHCPICSKKWQLKTVID